MANIFLDLPVPIANGAGAPVAVDAMGKVKTVTYQGDLFASVQLQASADGVDWHTLHTFAATAQAAGAQRLKKTFKVAARFMRAFVSNFRAGSAANMDVGANDDGTMFATPVAPAGDGAGVAVSVAALGTFNSVFVGGVFSGAAVIEVSDDAVDWSPCMSFDRNGGIKSKEFAAQFVRVVRNRVSPSAAGLPVVTVVAVDDPTPGGAALGAPNALIFRPGSGFAGPVIFDTWAGLVAELASLRAASNGGGVYQISIDDSITSPAVIPAGVYDMTDVVLTAIAAAGQDVDVDVADGASFTGLRQIKGAIAQFRVRNLNTVTPPVADLSAGDRVALDNVSFVAGGGAAAFFSGVGVGAGATVQFWLSRVGWASGTLDWPVATTFGLIAFDGTEVLSGAITGIAGASMDLSFYGSGVSVSPFQAGFLGTRSEFILAFPRWDLFPEPPAAPATGGGPAFTGLMLRTDTSGGPAPRALDAALNRKGFRTGITEEITGGLTSLVPFAGDTIDGVAAPFPVPAGGTVVVVADGVSNWIVQDVFDPTATGSAPHGLIFRPGSALVGPVIFNSWAALIAQLAILRAASNGGGLYEIGIDDSAAAAVIPAGAYDMTDVVLAGVRPDGGRVALAVADGATFTLLRSLRRLIIDYQGTAGGAVSDLDTDDLFNMVDTAISVSGTREFFDVAAPSGNSPSVINMYRLSRFDTGVFEVVDSAGAGGLQGGLSLRMFDGAMVDVDTLRGAGSVFVQWAVDSAHAEGTQANLTTLKALPLDEARYLTASAGESGGETGGSGGPIVTNFVARANQFIPVAPPSLGITGTLPKANLDNAGKRVTVKIEGGAIGVVTFATTGGDTIVGRTSLNEGGGVGTPPMNQEPSIAYISDGVSKWFELRPEVAPLYSPPEKWAQQNVPVSQVAVPLSALVSTSFDDIMMIRPGSIVGLNIRTINGPIAAGTITVTVSINGVPGTLSAVLGIGGVFARVTQAPGIDFWSVGPGNVVGLVIDTPAGLLPANVIDLEAWIEIEAVPQ